VRECESVKRRIVPHRPSAPLVHALTPTPSSAIDCAFARHRPPVILSATTLHPRRAAEAAARRIYDIGCATTGDSAHAGYGSFGPQPVAHAAKSAWSGLRVTGGVGRGMHSRSPHLGSHHFSEVTGANPRDVILSLPPRSARPRGTKLPLEPRAVCEAFRGCCCGFSRRWTTWLRASGRLSLGPRPWILQSPPDACADAGSAQRRLQDDMSRVWCGCIVDLGSGATHPLRPFVPPYPVPPHPSVRHGTAVPVVASFPMISPGAPMQRVP
jgi:hypothetical protein